MRNGPMREKAGRLVAPRFASWRRQQMVFSRVSSFRLLPAARTRHAPMSSGVWDSSQRCDTIFLCPIAWNVLGATGAGSCVRRG